MKISLIKLEPKHFPLFRKWWNDSKLRALTSEVNSKIKVSQEEIDDILKKHLINKDGHDFIITVDKNPVGHILIQKKKRKKYFEIYIAIGDKAYWGKGVGTKSMQKACEWFYKNYPKEKILTLNVLVNNHRAIKCYEKVGFKKMRIIHYKKFSDTILMKKVCS